MNQTFKKILSVVLSVAMLLAFAVPAFAAKTADEHPTVYVTGAQTNELYGADGSRIYPIGVDAGAVIKEALMPCIEKLLIGFATDNYEPYVKEFQAAFSPIFAKVKLDKNGEVSDGSHPQYTIYTQSVPKKTSGYGTWDYRFWYDWRISPLVAADELKIYIDMVKEATGEDKVNLMGRCYGANVIAAYLEKYTDHALESVADVSYLASSIMGIDMLDALYTGNIKFEEDAMNNFLNYFMDAENVIEDEATAAVVAALVDLFNQVYVLGFTGEMLEAVINEVKYDLFPVLLKDSFGTMPAYWSMVSPDKYLQAREFVFGDCEEEYAELLKKTDAFYEEVQLNFESTTAYLKSKGINFYIFAKYNFPDYPIYEGAAQQGDGNTSVAKQTFGATAADFGKVLDEDYLDSLATDKYVSPDLAIDASTCLYPETTWFVKDLHHNSFPNNFTNIAMDIMKHDYTVSDGVYAQYLQWEDGKIVGEVAPIEELPKEETKFSALYKFLMAIWNFIVNLFKV